MSRLASLWNRIGWSPHDAGVAPPRTDEYGFRPTITSLVAFTLVVTLAVGSVWVGTAITRNLVLAGVGAGLTAGLAVALLQSDRIVAVVLGSLLAGPAAGLLVIAPAYGLLNFAQAPGTLIGLGVALAAFGVTLSWTWSAGHKRVSGTLRRLGYVFVPVVVASVVVGVPAAMDLLKEAGADLPVSDPFVLLTRPVTLGVGSFLVMFAATTLAVRFAVRSKPTALEDTSGDEESDETPDEDGPLADIPHLERIIRSIERGRAMVPEDRLSAIPSVHQGSVLTIVATLAALVGIPLYLLEVMGEASDIYVGLSYDHFRLLNGITANEGLRVLLFASMIIALVAWAAFRLLDVVDRRDYGVVTDTVVPAAAGTVLAWAFIAIFGAEVERWLVDHFSDPSLFAQNVRTATDIVTADAVGAGLGVVAATLVVVVFSSLPFAAGLGYLPDRAVGPAVAAVGVSTVGIGLLLGRFPLSVGYAIVVLGVVTWDVGEYGVTMAEEAGQRARTHHAEVVHAGASLLVGLVAYGSGIVLLGVVDPSLVSGNQLAVGAVGALVGALVLLSAVDR